MNGNNENATAADTRPDRGDSAFDPSVDPGKYAAVPTIDPNWVSLTRFKIRTAKDDNNNNTAIEYVFRNGRQQAKFHIDIEARNQNGEVVAVPPAYLEKHLKLIRRDGGAPFNFDPGVPADYSPVPSWWPSLESYVEQSEELGAAWSVHAPDEEMEKCSSASAEAPDAGGEDKPYFRWLPVDDGSYWPLQEYVITAGTTSEIREWVAVSLLAPNGITLFTTNDQVGGTPGKFRSYVRFVSLPLYPDAIKYNYTETFLGTVWGRWRFYHYKLTIQLHGHNVPIRIVRSDASSGPPYQMWGSHGGKSHTLMQCDAPGSAWFGSFSDPDIQARVKAYKDGLCDRINPEQGAQSFITTFCDANVGWSNRTSLNGKLTDIYGTVHAIRIKYYESSWWYIVERA
ncbi:hypothetical protein [Stenotrophomonas sp. PS02289]|uniref:hypothetical protein n=1 Tax=Stenotrophomonas sp. PS02289 TaxID=2991422 RepID=UPI00249CE705|nr:hypothetical protein [Stenotrophomonas sp. PS02289]